MTDKTSVLRDIFGFDAFRPGQEAIVDDLLANHHVLAVMPTGSGKSLCYQVPALVKGGLAVVVSPLVALMQDQVAALKFAGVRAETINSSASREDNIAIWQKVTAGEIAILYMAPERLMTERMIQALQKVRVSMIAVDEAHCISQWGASFRPEYEMLHGLRAAFPETPIGAFTATADEAARRDIVDKLFGGLAKVHLSGFDRPNISLTVVPKSNTGNQLLAFLAGRKGTSGIVYALSRKSCEEWATHLQKNGYRAIAYHAGLSPAMRSRAQEMFMAERGVIVCATIAFGMGIDKPDVRFVFHADLPSSLDAYYQEIGRAGRDGLPADAYMVFGIGDMRLRRGFIDNNNADDLNKRREHRRLDALITYCETPTCRRTALLSYFGEMATTCGNCDVCKNPVELLDGTEIARKILDAVHATGQRFGASHIIDIVMGKATARALELRHGDLKEFGTGRAHPRSYLQSLIRQMTASGALRLDMSGFGGLAIAAKGESLLRGAGRFLHRPDAAPANKKPRRAKNFGDANFDDQNFGDSGAEPPQDQLLLRLKDVRRRLALERKVPAYIVFSDKTLIDMARVKPRSKAEFAELHGVGAAKLKEFATAFLIEIASVRDE